MINAVVGSGILSLPYGFRKVGLSAIVLLALTAWCSSKANKLMICAFHAGADMRKEQLRYNYMQVAYSVFGQPGAVLVGIMARFLYILVTALFLKLCGETLGSISPDFGNHSWIVLSGLTVLLITVAIPNL